MEYVQRQKLITLEEMANAFVSTFTSLSTQRNYSDGFRQLFDQGLLDRRMSLAEFSSLDAGALLQKVRTHCKSKGQKGRKAFVERTEDIDFFRKEVVFKKKKSDCMTLKL